jgi:hypothetical protein
MPPVLPDGSGARSGMSISSTTTARSWNSSTLNVARPCLQQTTDSCQLNHHQQLALSLGCRAPGFMGQEVLLQAAAACCSKGNAAMQQQLSPPAGLYPAAAAAAAAALHFKAPMALDPCCAQETSTAHSAIHREKNHHNTAASSTLPDMRRLPMAPC